MSLDIYLTLPKDSLVETKERGSGIFVRRNGQTVEISRAEWDELNPGIEPVIYRGSDATGGIWHGNITHNLNLMAMKAYLYHALWRPEELQITRAGDLIPLLSEGLKRLQKDPNYYKIFNPANGWGTYETLVSFVECYLEACTKFPEATVNVWR